MILAALILVTSADDLLVDFIYWVRRAIRAYLAKRWYKPLTTEQLAPRRRNRWRSSYRPGTNRTSSR